jgi:two-component system phosphate regulon response regulator PhoB
MSFTPLIFVAEDEAGQADILKYNLQEQGFKVSIANNGLRAYEKILEQQPDLLVLDWMLPEMSGIEVCRKLRANDETKRLPIIMLTARGEEDDRLRGFEVGADDYLVKPYLTSELIARIWAILRRTRPELAEEKLEFEGILLDLAQHKTTRDGDSVELSTTEFRLLRALLARPGRVFSRAQLIDLAWGTGIFLEDRTVDVCIRRIRSALNINNKPDLIRTVRGTGYSIDRPQ